MACGPSHPRRGYPKRRQAPGGLVGTVSDSCRTAGQGTRDSLADSWPADTARYKRGSTTFQIVEGKEYVVEFHPHARFQARQDIQHDHRHIRIHEGSMRVVHEDHSPALRLSNMKRSVFSTGLRIMEQVRIVIPGKSQRLIQAAEVGLLTGLGRDARYAPRARSPRLPHHTRSEQWKQLSSASIPSAPRSSSSLCCSFSRPSGRYVWTRFTLRP